MLKSQSAANTNDHPLDTFIHERSYNIPTLDLELQSYRHKATGAQHFHLKTETTEQAFMVSFKTVPTDSTGVAHILEHTTLCGSEKYPVRDPFFMMLRRSLSTFMNAFTSSDWTAYPFATQNRKDFFNLLSVYLDATFFPSLNPLDFAQEGHRLEYTTPDDVSSPLLYKGVVFNEMKGAMSSINSILIQKISRHLFPSTTYHFNSGGEPQIIPELTYEDLVSFHKKHYHPSNANFYTYGNLPLQELQTQFEQHVISRFKDKPDPIEVTLQAPTLAPVKVHEYYGIDDQDTEQKTYLAISWQMGESANAQSRLEAMLVSNVLMLNSASPLRHMLETYPHGTAPLSVSGLEDTRRQMCFTCGVEGSDPQYADDLEQSVFKVLEDIARDGVPQEILESICHQLELHQREITGSGMPYGLQLILTTHYGAIHGGDPSELLDIDPALVQLREHIQNPEYIKGLIQKLLIDNKHMIRLILSPDVTLNERTKSFEAEQLSKINDALSDEEKAKIVSTAAELKKRQAQEDDVSVLPCVTLSDVPDQIPYAEPDQTTETSVFSLSLSEKGQTRLFPVPQITHFKAGTNGISYVDTVMPLPQLTPEEMGTLKLLKSCLPVLGVGKDDYLTIQKKQAEITGGIGLGTDYRVPRDSTEVISGFISIGSKALDRNLEPMIALLDKTLHEVRFDETQRIRELIAQSRARHERSVTNQGHALAMKAAGSCLRPLAHHEHHYGYGLAQIKSLKALDDGLNSPEKLDELSEKMKALHGKLLAMPKARLIVSDLSDWAKLEGTLSKLPNQDQAFNPLEYKINPQPRSQAWVTNTQVNFCAQAFATVAPSHDDSAALTVLGSFLRDGFLHRAIREEGGAYGGGAAHRASGYFVFYSYRDPRLTETLDDFQASIRWLLDSTHDARPLEEAILGVISSLDKPHSPAGEASSSYYNALYGRDANTYHQLRKKVLAITLEDLKRVAEKYLLTDNNALNATAIVTNSTTLEALEEKSKFEIFEL